MQETLNNFLNFVTTFDYTPYLNIYVFMGAIFFLSIFFVYGVYKFMPQSGFSKESTIDFVSVGIISAITSALFLIGNITQLISVKVYFTNQYWYLSLLSGVLVVFLLSLANKWSRLKVLDVFSPATLLFLGLIFIVVAIFFQLMFFAVSGLFLIIFSRSIKNALQNRFSSLFGIVKVEKADEYSFIGGVFLISMFVTTSISLIGVLLMYAGKITYWYLGLLIVLLILILLTFVKRSRKFKLKWRLQINLLKNKNKNLKKKEEKPLKKLID